MRLPPPIMRPGSSSSRTINSGPLLNAIHYILSKFDYKDKDLRPEYIYGAIDNEMSTDMIVDGVLFSGMNRDQVAILERIHIHE